MQEKTPDDLVDDVIDRLIGKRNALGFDTILGNGGGRIDISKPNIHDSKSDFLRERESVKGGIKSFEQALKHILPDRDDIEQATMIGRLSQAIDDEAAKKLNKVKVEEANELAMRNIVQTGFYLNTLFVTLRMVEHLKNRLKELQDQEVEFWSIPNRAPNYHARTIALRLARLYAREKGQFPTFGTSRDGGHPSTEFGRALEEIFQILKIKARVPNAARWAIAQLTETDIVPEQNALMGGILGQLAAQKPSKAPSSVIDILTQPEPKDP